MSKINIFRKEWIDIVFEGRNKSYGAYRLRSRNPKVTAFALFLGITLFGGAVVSPLVLGAIEGSLGIVKKKKIDKVIEVIDLTPPPPPVEIPPVEAPPPPPPPEAPASIKDQVKFTPPKVEAADIIPEEKEIATLEDLKDADPSSKTEKGKEDGDIIINKESGEGPKGSEGDGDGDQIFTHVQVQAGPPGGMAAFNKTFINRFRTPDIDSSVKRIQVIVQFVVEKDGSLTDINVLRDPGYGAGKEAARVLKGMPKWKPAVQNGKTVRSRFTLPITIQVQ